MRTGATWAPHFWTGMNNDCSPSLAVSKPIMLILFPILRADQSAGGWRIMTGPITWTLISNLATSSSINLLIIQIWSCWWSINTIMYVVCHDNSFQLLGWLFAVVCSSPKRRSSLSRLVFPLTEKPSMQWRMLSTWILGNNCERAIHALCLLLRNSGSFCFVTNRKKNLILTAGSNYFFRPKIRQCVHDNLGK
jgi:hypothetical protein